MKSSEHYLYGKWSIYTSDSINFRKKGGGVKYVSLEPQNVKYWYSHEIWTSSLVNINNARVLLSNMSYIKCFIQQIVGLKHNTITFICQCCNTQCPIPVQKLRHLYKDMLLRNKSRWQIHLYQHKLQYTNIYIYLYASFLTSILWFTYQCTLCKRKVQTKSEMYF